MTTHDRINELTERFLLEVGEHCDAVQVLATWNEEGESQRHASGKGNWYARTGMALEFLEMAKARNQYYVRNKEFPTDPDDNET